MILDLLDYKLYIHKVDQVVDKVRPVYKGSLMKKGGDNEVDIIIWKNKYKDRDGEYFSIDFNKPNPKYADKNISSETKTEKSAHSAREILDDIIPF